jgi:hypothetical protein
MSQTHFSVTFLMRQCVRLNKLANCDIMSQCAVQVWLWNRRVVVFCIGGYIVPKSRRGRMKKFIITAIGVALLGFTACNNDDLSDALDLGGDDNGNYKITIQQAVGGEIVAVNSGGIPIAAANPKDTVTLKITFTSAGSEGEEEAEGTDAQQASARTADAITGTETPAGGGGDTEQPEEPVGIPTHYLKTLIITKNGPTNDVSLIEAVNFKTGKLSYEANFKMPKGNITIIPTYGEYHEGMELDSSSALEKINIYLNDASSVLYSIDNPHADISDEFHSKLEVPFGTTVVDIEGIPVNAATTLCPPVKKALSPGYGNKGTVTITSTSEDGSSSENFHFEIIVKNQEPSGGTEYTITIADNIADAVEIEIKDDVAAIDNLKAVLYTPVKISLKGTENTFVPNTVKVTGTIGDTDIEVPLEEDDYGDFTFYMPNCNVTINAQYHTVDLDVEKIIVTQDSTGYTMIKKDGAYTLALASNGNVNITVYPIGESVTVSLIGDSETSVSSNSFSWTLSDGLNEKTIAITKDSVTAHHFLQVYTGYQAEVTGGGGSGGSGGTVEFIPTAHGGYEEVHTFTNTGSSDQASYTLGFKSKPNVYAEVLVVAGGGAGGAATNAHSAGGGGAGGLLYKNVLLDQTSYDIKVGRGGKGNTTPYNSTQYSSTSHSENGKNSSMAGGTVNLVATGGGGGADHSMGNANRGANGGSGGGNGNSQGTPGQPVSGQGNHGGYGGSLFSGGGGGGAGSEGYDPPAIKRTGRGGYGISIDISGNQKIYAGGGAGGFVYNGINIAAGPSVLGSTPTGSAGENGTGNGGSGGGTGICNGDGNTVTIGSVTYRSADANAGYNGGSGIVIVRFPVVFPKPTPAPEG